MVVGVVGKCKGLDGIKNDKETLKGEHRADPTRDVVEFAWLE
jgi:hypothetical protein